MSKERRFFPLLLSLTLLVIPQHLVAQSDRGTVTGTVVDAAAAVIPGAALTLINTATGAVYTTVTTETGNYTLPSLPVGMYNLTAVKQGFGKYVQEGIQVQVAVSLRIDVTLQVGSSVESVTVIASAPLLRTESADQSFNITGDQVNALPLTQGSAGLRNPIAFAQLTPGMSVPATNTTGNFQARVNGLPASTFRTLVDGQDITNSIDPSHLSESHPSMEALQEVALTSSNYAAEFGRVGGGLFNLTSRSGTNLFHGSAYEYWTNEAFNAGRPLTDDGSGHLLRPRSRSHNYDFSVGGPVIIPKLYNGRNRTFFFFNWEQWRQKSSSSGTFSTVPTAAYREGNFSQALTGRNLGTDVLGRPIVENQIYDPLTSRVVNGQIVRDPFANNIIPPNRIDPIAAKIQAMIPAATNSALINNYAIVDAYTTVKSIPSLKIDHNFGDKTKISFYWSQWRQDRDKNTFDGLPFPISPAREYIDRTPTYRLTIDQTITPTLLVHLGGGVVHYVHTDSSPQSVLQYDAVKELGLVGASVTPSGFPQINGLSGTQGGMSSTIGPTNAGTYYNDKPTLVGSVTWIRSNHTWKFGGEWQKDIWSNVTAGNTMGTYAFNARETALPYLQTTTIGGGSIGFPYASFLLGTVGGGTIANRQDSQWRKHNYGVFVQDTWKVTRRLTFDYGVRWDYQVAFQELHDRNSAFSPTVRNPSAGGLLGGTQYEGSGPGRCNCSFTDPYPFAFGPRLGVAYQLSAKTVLRAGWGLVYGTTPSVNYQLGGALGTGFNTLTFSNPTFGEPAFALKDGLRYNPADLYVASLDPGIRPSPGQINAPPTFVDLTGARPGRINQWNVAIQREFLNDFSVEVAYVGNRAVWLQADGMLDLNALTEERLAGFGLNVNNAADRTLLTSAMSSPQVQARGFQVPYQGFPANSTLAQALRPYPQFSSIGTRWASRGNTWYDSLQVKLTKRYSHGLTMTGGFTWQKELVLGALSGLAISQSPQAVNDIFNRQQNKYISADSQPLQFVLGFTYQTPAVGSNRFVRTLLRDWDLNGIFRYASGLPIRAPSAQNNLNTLLFRSTMANRVPGEPLFLKDLDCHCIDPNKDFVLNPAAWSDPASGQFGTAAAYYNDYRYQRRPVETVSFGRTFRIKESMNFQVRAEFFNAFNRTQINNPDSTNALATPTRNSAGVPTNGFGRINPGSLYSNPRSGQILARFQF